MGKGGKQNRAGQEAMRSCSFRIQIQPDSTGSSGISDRAGGGGGREWVGSPEVVVVVRLNLLDISS